MNARERRERYELIQKLQGKFADIRGDSGAVKDWGLEFIVRDELAAYKLGYHYRNNPHGYKIERADAGDFVVTVWNERAMAMGCDV